MLFRSYKVNNGKEKKNQTRPFYPPRPLSRFRRFYSGLVSRDVPLYMQNPAFASEYQERATCCNHARDSGIRIFIAMTAIEL